MANKNTMVLFDFGNCAGHSGAYVQRTQETKNVRFVAIKAIFSYFSNVFIKETCIPTRFLFTNALIFVKKSSFDTE